MNQFFSLTPQRVLDAVERALAHSMPGARSTGRSLALNSLENRVYAIELEGGTEVVTKFYRPGRWTPEQIQEEHDFLAKLNAAEIPAVAPLHLDASGSTIAASSFGVFFAVFPKVRGRIRDELSDVQLATLGRYLARIHAVGRTFPCTERLALDFENFVYKPLDFLLASPLLPESCRAPYEAVVERFLELAVPMFEHREVEVLPLHGDCHLGNTLWDGDKPFFLDFDDMVVAPQVQDVWMIVRGRDEDAKRQRGLLLDAYEEMLPFPRGTLDLIEPLRAMRMIHYAAWVARRWEDPSFPKAFPEFLNERHWREEHQALEEICSLLESGDA